MDTLDTVDDVAESIAIGFVMILVAAMVVCVSAMVGLMWKAAVAETGLITGTIIWIVSVSIAFSVSWTAHMRNR